VECYRGAISVRFGGEQALTTKLDPTGSGFNVSKYADRDSTFGLLAAESGVGKTYFILRHCPPPIAYFWFDNRSQDNLDQARDAGIAIYDKCLSMPTSNLSAEETKKAAREIQEFVIHNIIWATQKNRCRTIAIDTATEFSHILKLAFDGVKEQTKEGAFGKDKDWVKYQWQRVAAIVRNSPCNLICTSRVKEVWRTNENGQQVATGVNTYRCPEEVSELLDWTVELKLEETLAGRRRPKFKLDVIKSGNDLSKYGKTYRQKDWEDLSMNPFEFIRWELQGKL
jgi:hypothetical protein